MVFRRGEVLNGCDVDIGLKIACLADGFCEVRCHNRERCAFKALVILFVNVVAWCDIGAVEIDGNTRQEKIARLGNSLYCERGMFKEVRKGCFQGVDEFVSKFSDCHSHNVSSFSLVWYKKRVKGCKCEADGKHLYRECPNATKLHP